MPCSAPPFGELVAVDVNRGAVAWRVPLGVVRRVEGARLRQDRHAEHRRHASRPPSGLVFIGATIDRRFRAFDAQTGALLWETTLEASAHATPMTFMGRNRRQYVVVAASGNGILASPPGSKICGVRVTEVSVRGRRRSRAFNRKTRRHEDAKTRAIAAFRNASDLSKSSNAESAKGERRLGWFVAGWRAPVFDRRRGSVECENTSHQTVDMACVFAFD